MNGRRLTTRGSRAEEEEEEDRDMTVPRVDTQYIIMSAQNHSVNHFFIHEGANFVKVQ